ncbi:hypothetical protein [Paenibacillus sp. LHD-38]|uniref:hypothetical protein n=1 Tax=Paenibacillus sp. LHD-38 TaxID=3072143 RepID=UPI002810531B|nr:hypothetical protein [Paenibacillus sp. LHD-38]MDQ8738584.1 hypothetical protein [Paenibacillus sp. LHD-38]
MLKLDHFYKEKRGSDITSWRKGRLTATELIEDVVEAYINNLFDYSNLKVIENRNLVHWIINKVTAHICLSYFKEWLNIAKQRSKNIIVPTSAEIKGMKDRCIPEMAFRFHPDMAKKQSVEFYYETKNTLHSLMDRSFGECPHEKKSIRSSLYSMKSYGPLGASMMYNSHMTEENKELRQYVDQYVLRLTL